MSLSKQDEERLQELVIQLENVYDKIWVFMAPFKEGKGVFLSSEQMKELKELFDQQDKLKDEFMSIPKR